MLLGWIKHGQFLVTWFIILLVGLWALHTSSCNKFKLFTGPDCGCSRCIASIPCCDSMQKSCPLGWWKRMAFVNENSRHILKWKYVSQSPSMSELQQRKWGTGSICMDINQTQMYRSFTAPLLLEMSAICGRGEYCYTRVDRRQFPAHVVWSSFASIAGHRRSRVHRTLTWQLCRNVDAGGLL